MKADNIVAMVLRFVWNAALVAFFSYLIFWQHHSGWWFLFMLVLWMKRDTDNDNNKLKVVRFKKTSNNFQGNYPFNEGENLLLLGGIENMPNHVAVADKEGKVYWAYRAKNFVERDNSNG